MHQRLYDLDLQLRDLGEAGIDQGMRSEQLVFASDYPEDFTGGEYRHGKGNAGAKKICRSRSRVGARSRKQETNSRQHRRHTLTKA